MKRAFLPLLIVSILAFGGAPAASAQTTQGSSAKAEVLAAVAARDKAFVAGDEKTVAQFMAENYLQTNVQGRVQDKATWLREYFEPIAAKIKSGGFRWVVFKKSNVQVRDLGNVAVVIGTLTLKAAGVSPEFDKLPPGSLRFTQVWVKRAGGWKVVVLQNAYTNAESFQKVSLTRKIGAR